MPTPIDILMDPVSQIFLAIYAALFMWEFIAPGRRLQTVKGWHLKGLVFFLAYFFLSTYLPLLTDGYLSQFQLIDLSSAGTFIGVIVGVFIFQLFLYFWHRALHHFDFLWKTFHQMHHSAERLDMAGAFYFSPLDMIGFTLVGSVSLVLGVGIDPQAATIVLLILSFMGMFTHANIKTPQWLGYIVERPEGHTVHHARGLHRYNYAELPLIDMLFGTFRNPKEFEHEVGFYDGASSRVGEMLLFRDVSKPKRGKEVGCVTSPKPSSRSFHQA